MIWHWLTLAPSPFFIRVPSSLRLLVNRINDTAIRRSQQLRCVRGRPKKAAISGSGKYKQFTADAMLRTTFLCQTWVGHGHGLGGGWTRNGNENRSPSVGWRLYYRLLIFQAKIFRYMTFIFMLWVLDLYSSGGSVLCHHLRRFAHDLLNFEHRFQPPTLIWGQLFLSGRVNLVGSDSD